MSGFVRSLGHDSDPPSPDCRVVEDRHGARHGGRVGELDVREAARQARVAVEQEGHADDRAGLREVRLELGGRRLVRDVADVDAAAVHVLLLSLGDALARGDQLK